METKIIYMTNLDSGFYERMGAFLSKRDIVKEIGINVWDDDSNKWFIAINPIVSFKLYGFSSVTVTKEYLKINTLYTLPIVRNKGIAKTILQAIIDYCINKNISKIKVTSTEVAIKLYKSFNFVEIGKKGKYTILSLEIKKAI